MMRPARLTAATAGALLALLTAACGSTTTGNPNPSPSDSTQPDPSSTSTTPSSPGTKVTSPKDAVRMLKHTDPCDLLSNADLAELKITSPGETADSNSSRGCGWESDQSVITVAIRSHQSIDTFKLGDGKLSTIKINGREAKQQRGEDGGCDVTVRVTDDSRVDILVDLRDESKSCAGAKQVARLVEPHLPSVQQ
jgi:hypothetical protein